MSDDAFVLTLIGLVGILVAIFGFRETRKRTAILSAISDLERLNEVLSAGIGDQVRVREIIEKLRKAVE